MSSDAALGAVLVLAIFITAFAHRSVGSGCGCHVPPSGYRPSTRLILVKEDPMGRDATLTLALMRMVELLERIVQALARIEARAARTNELIADIDKTQWW
jgi:hypothetical protein